MKSITLFFSTMNAGKGILLILAPILTMILSMKTGLLALAFIVFLDMVTGIRKSLHENGRSFSPFKKEFWHGISSNGLRESWRKIYEYGIGILTFIILDSMVLGGTSFMLFEKQLSLPELAVAIASMVEVYSIYENMEAVSGNNLFKRITSFFPSKWKEAFTKKE